MLERVAPSLRALEEAASAPLGLFFEPPLLDVRIVNQYALFGLMSTPSARLDDWLIEQPRSLRRIVMPADLTREVRGKLDQANITERVLLPGLDGLCRWLTRYHSPGSLPG